jgi:hypothetical protein
MKHLRFDEYPPVSGFTTVKVEGDNMEDVVQASTRS